MLARNVRPSQSQKTWVSGLQCSGGAGSHVHEKPQPGGPAQTRSTPGQSRELSQAPGGSSTGALETAGLLEVPGVPGVVAGASGAVEGGSPPVDATASPVQAPVWR